MGKVFVKGPVESPDDLLAKESQAARIGRVGLDATQGAVNLTRPQSIQNFGDLAGVPLNIARYFMEGRHKRKLSPQEEAIQNARLRQTANETLAQQNAQQAADAERAENISIMEGMDPNDKYEDRQMAPLPEVTGSRFSRAGRQERTDSKQALQSAMDKRVADYERLQAAGKLPLQERAENERIKAAKEKARLAVESEDYRRGFRGQKQRGGEQVHGKAEQTIAASNATEPTMVGVSGKQGDTMPPEIRQQRERNIANQKIAEMAQGPNVAAIAAHPETTSLPEGGESAENNNDAAMEAKVNEQGLNDNSESTQEALQQQSGEKEEPDLNEATEGAMQVPAINFNAGPPQLPQDVQTVFSGNDAVAQMQRDRGRD